jgi:hypothetical protein
VTSIAVADAVVVAVAVAVVVVVVVVVVVKGVHALAGDGVRARVGEVHPMLRGRSAQHCVGVSRVRVRNGGNMYG